MSELKIGPLPKVRYIRRNIRLPETLDAELAEYAAEYGRVYEPVDLAELIPHMLDAFLRSDRGWRARRAKLDPLRGRSPSGAGDGRRGETGG